MLKKSISIKKANILIMGFSFKENCPDIRNTGVISVTDALKNYDCEVDVYDPWVSKDEAINLYNINVINNVPEKKYDAVFIAVAHACFLEIGVEGIINYCKRNYVIFDFKYLFDFDLRLERL